jgi:hypothetical protein
VRTKVLVDEEKGRERVGIKVHRIVINRLKYIKQKFVNAAEGRT